MLKTFKICWYKMVFKLKCLYTLLKQAWSSISSYLLLLTTKLEDSCAVVVIIIFVNGVIYITIFYSTLLYLVI